MKVNNYKYIYPNKKKINKKMRTKVCGCLLLLFFIFCIIPWITISSIVLDKYNEIRRYNNNCICSFDNLHDNAIDASYGRFSYISIETNATCNGQELNVTINWPPGAKWIDPKSDKELVEYINRITFFRFLSCKIDEDSLTGVTENISAIGAWIFSLCLSTAISFIIIILSCYFFDK